MLGLSHAIGVDQSDNVWRVVALRAAGAGYEVVYAASIPGAVGGYADHVSALAEPLRQAGVARMRAAGAVPASGCAFKTASLPPGRPSELAQVARFEAETQLPLPLQELVWGYSLMPEPSGRQHAVIVGTRRTLVDEQMGALRQAGVNPVALLPAPLAAAASISLPDGPHLLVRAGLDWSDVCLYDGRRLLGCRSVRAGDPAAEGWAESIARELRPWLLGDAEPRIITLLGEVTAESVEALAQTTGLTVMVGDPWQQVRDPRRRLEELTDPGSAFATAIGLAKAALNRSAGINLLPAQVREERSGQRKLLWALAVLVLALGALAPVALLLNGQWEVRQTELRAVQNEVRTVRRSTPAPPSLGVTTARQVVADLRQLDNRPLELLWQLSDELPEGIALTDLTYTRGKVMVLKGRADMNTTLAAAVETLNRMGIFDHATLDYSTGVKDETAQGFDFQITCPLPAGSDPTLGIGKRSTRTRQGSVAR